MLKGPIALGTIRTSLILGARLFVQAGTLLLVARMLGPEDFGTFAGIAALAVLLGALSSFGANLVLLGEMSRDCTRRNDVLSYAIPTTLLISSFLFVLYIVISFWLVPDKSLSFWVLFALGVAEILLQPLLGLMGAEHHALSQVAKAQFMQNIPLVLRLLMAALIFFSGVTPAVNLYATGYLTASIMVLLIAGLYLPEKWPSWSYWRLPTRLEMRHGFSYAAVNVSRTASTELDKAIAMKLVPMEAAGIYVAGSRVVGAVTLPIAAMILAALPRLFREVGHVSKEPRPLLIWMYVAAIVYTTLLAAILWLVAPLLENMFGMAYQGMVEAVRWLCLAVPGMSIRMIAGAILVTNGDASYRMRYEYSGVFLMLLGSIVLTPRFGVFGLVLSVVISEWIMALIGTRKVFARHIIKGRFNV